MEARLTVDFTGEEHQIDYERLFNLLQFAANTSPVQLVPAGKPSLAGVTVVILKNVERLQFCYGFRQLKILRSRFGDWFRLPPISQGFWNSLYEAAGHSSQKGTEGLQQDAILKKYGLEKHSVTRYILTEEEMRRYNYPLEGSTRWSDFVHGDCRAAVSDKSPLFGLDCEMVFCWAGGKTLQPKLACVSLMNSGGRMIWDELVKPKFPIKKYTTRSPQLLSKADFVSLMEIHGMKHDSMKM